MDDIILNEGFLLPTVLIKLITDKWAIIAPHQQRSNNLAD